MGYTIGFWNGIHIHILHRAQKWRDENPNNKASARLDVVHRM